MSIKKNNSFYLIILMLAILYMFTNIFERELFNIIKEKFIIKTCPPGQIEGPDGNCTCPLVGQIYKTDTKVCECAPGRTEQTINNKTICL